MKKKTSKFIVHKPAPGAFAATLKAAEELRNNFRSTNLDWALCKAIEDGWLFILPEGTKFAYSRGCGPVSLQDVRLGHHEPSKEGLQDWAAPRVLTAQYAVRVTDNEGDDDRRVPVNVHVPSRFLNYVLRSRGIAHAPHLTNLEFVYKVEDLRIWMREVQMKLYGDAERACHVAIKKAKDRIEILRALRRGETKPEHQSAFE